MPAEMRPFFLGFVVAFLLSGALGRPLIMLLSRWGGRQTINPDAPERHRAKQGTPTMGGLLILAGLVASCLAYVMLFTDDRPLSAFTIGWGRGQTAIIGLLALTLLFGAIGFTDDMLIAKRGHNLGLKARYKLAAQLVVSIIFIGWIAHDEIPGRTTLLVWWPGHDADVGIWYYPLAVLFIVGLSNAVNFADGLDGLAGGMALLIAIGLGAVGFAVCQLAWIPLYAGGIAGGCAGFLLFNQHPARIFMGDTGSLALGAALAGLAIMGKAEMPAILCTLVCWSELISVIIQVISFKTTGRRVFRMTPLHHHFELIGWSETQIVNRFWAVTGICVATAIVISRFYP